MKKYIVYMLIFLIDWGTSYAQHFSFSHITENEGLPYNVVNCFLQDRSGFFWIGTYNGFCRFDGNNFFSHKIRKGANSMQSEVVHSLCQDKEGNIWGGTDNGVFCYIPSKDSFINHKIKSLNKNGVFYEVLCDKQGIVWASGIWSLFKYDVLKRQFHEIIKTVSHTDSTHTYRITKNGIVESTDGQSFWLTTNTGLLRYDKRKNKIISSKQEYENTQFNNHAVSAITMSTKGKIWYYDNYTHELIQFDPQKKTVTSRINLSTTISNHFVATIFEDRNDRLWVCTWQYDMLVIELKNNNRIHQLEHKPENRQSVASSFFWDAFQDKDNIVWLGTIAGISKTCPERDLYTSFQLNSKISALKNDALSKVAEHPNNGDIWVSTKASRLIQYNRHSGQITIHDMSRALPNQNGQLPGEVNGIQFYHDEVIVSTYTGSWVLEPNGHLLKPFKLLPKEYANFNCAELLINDTAAYYNSSREILFWNRKTNRATIINQPYDTTLFRKYNFNQLSKGPKGMYAYAYKGDYLTLLDHEQRPTAVQIGTIYKDGGGGIFKLATDNKQAIWIAYRGSGLYRYEPNSKKLSFWNETDGLAGNRMHNFELDQQDRVWVMMYNKISVFIPVTKKFYSFKIPFSENNYYYINAMAKCNSGNILGTIGNELFEFYPDKLYLKPALQKPIISALILPDQEISLYNPDDISLASEQNTIRFLFGSLISSAHFSYDLQYRLQGAESKWTLAKPNQSEALYNNLNPGKYIFQVRAVSKNADWQTEEAVLHFTIKTPWYKTWIAYLIYSCLSFIIFYSVYRFRVNKQKVIHNLETKTQRLEREKAMVMYESLKQQLNPHFLFNSLSSLNSLIARDTKMARQFLDSLSKTYRYILKSRDSETVSLIDELRFAQNYINLQKTRFGEGFEVNINVPSDYNDMRIVPVTIQNLIENALKHNITDPENPLIINIYIEDGFLIIENNVQLKGTVETSNKQGLINLQSLYSFLSDKPVAITQTEHRFILKLPLI